MNDAALISTAISHLYTDHRPWLQQWLRRKLGCPERAADLAQDTFMRLLLTRRADEVREPRAYLGTIARGLLFDHYRRAALEAAYLEALAALPEPQSPSPESRLLIVEALVQVDRLLDELPAPVRRAFLLSQLDGLTYAQISEQLGVSDRTVKRYMVQAFAQCLGALE